jgi:hypothetical protein
MVYTDTGLVPIAEIQPGQWVYSLDPETRRIIKQRVRGTMYKGKLPVFEVKVAGRTLKATYNHPFYAIVYEKGEGKQRGKIRVWPDWRCTCATLAIAGDSHQRQDAGQFERTPP